MNRVRMILFAGVLGAFGFGTTPAQAQSVTSTPTRRVSYAPSGGYYYGGYSNAAPQPAPLYYGRSIDPAPVRSHTPSWASTMRHRVGSSYDPSGRHDGLARPWLR
jgi:DNA-binding beta-propeller fold protein YncE